MNKYELEHRVVMSKMIGRELLATEIVHHIDFSKSNNDPKNLFLFKDLTNHNYYHYKHAEGIELKYEY